MGKCKKIAIIISLILFAIIITNNAYATSPIDDPNSYLPSSDPDIPQNVLNVAGAIITIIQSVGIVVAVISIMVIGIQYMIGSAEQKAEYRKTAMGFLIGAVLLFSAATIIKLVYNVTISATDDTNESITNTASEELYDKLNKNIHIHGRPSEGIYETLQ